MKAAVLVTLMSAVLLTGCATTKPCKVTPPPAPAIKPAVVAPVVATPAPAPVVAAPAPVPVVTASAEPVRDYKAEFAANVKDIFFDFDKSTIRADQQATLDADIAFLKANPSILFDIVSSCDVVGSDKYNNSLGQRRVDRVSVLLIGAGISDTRFIGSTLGKTSSYCTAPKCQELNRRVHFTYSGTK